MPNTDQLVAIDRLAVIMLENRSFDRMLGFLCTDQGFVTNFAATLTLRAQQGGSILPGTTAKSIMGCFAPETLPVMSALVRGCAVCVHWYAPAPTESLPNRAFASAASQDHLDDVTHTVTVPSIFGLLSQQNLGWAVYGYAAQPLARGNLPDINTASAAHFGLFTDFREAAANGTLQPFNHFIPASDNNEH